MKNSIYRVIRKCLWKKIHIKYLLLITFVVSLTFVEFYTNYLVTKNDIAIQEGYKEYGEFQFQISGLTYDKALIISQEKDMKKTCIYSAQYVVNENAYTYYINTDFFDFSNVKLSEGKFPEKENEIMCEKKYLYKKGLEFSSDSITKIEYNGKEYIVSGVVSINDIGVTMNLYIPVLFLNYNTNKDLVKDNILACMTDTDKYTKISDYLRVKYEILEDNLIYNNNVLSYAKVNEYNKSTDVFNPLRYIVLIVSFALFILIVSNIIVIVTKKIKNETMIIRALGIRIKTIEIEFEKIILKILVTADIIAFIVLGIALNCYYHKVEYSPDVIRTIVLMVCIAVLHHILVLIVAFLSFRKHCSGTIHKAVSNIDDVSIHSKNMKSRLYGKKLPFLKVAKLSVSMNKTRQILSVLVITISVVAITVFNYISQYIFDLEENDSYDYRIDYEYSDIKETLFGSDEIKSVYKDMLARTDIFDIYPIYYSQVSVELNKSDVSDQYKNYYAELSNENYLKFVVNKTGSYSDRFIFIGADEAILKKVYCCDYGQLADDECIVVESVSTPNNTSFPVGIKVGTKLQSRYMDIENECEKSSEWKVVDIVDSINIAIPNTYYKCYVIVNMKNFEKFELYNYPQLIYFNDKHNDYDNIHEYFKGITDINVVNIADENEQIKEQRFTSTVILYLLLILLLVLLAINTIISLLDRYDMNRRKFAMLKAIGIGNSKLYLIQLYDYYRTIFTSLILGTILSYIVCYLVYLRIRNELFYFIFKFSYSDLLLPVGVVILIFAVSLLPSYFRIKKINIIEDLQRNK